MDIKEYNHQISLLDGLRPKLHRLRPVPLNGKRIVFQLARMNLSFYELQLACHIALLARQRGIEPFILLDDGFSFHWDTMMASEDRLPDIPEYKRFFAMGEASERNQSLLRDIIALFDPWMHFMFYSSLMDEEELKSPRKWNDASIERHAVMSCKRYFSGKEFSRDSEYFRQSVRNCKISQLIAEKTEHRIKPDYVYIPHGFYSLWGPFYDHFKNRLDVKISLYGSWVKKTNAIRLLNRPLLEFNDFPEYYSDILPKMTDRELNWSRDWLKNRFSGNAYDLQRFEDGRQKKRQKRLFDNDNPTFCVFPNMIWDAAGGSGSNLDFIFTDSKAWVLAVIDYFATHPHCNAIIRFHPTERRYIGKAKATEDIIREEKPEINHLPNLKVISSNEPVSSYDMASDGVFDIGLIYTGTLSIELPALGVPVIIAAKSMYYGKGFCYEPGSRQDYFSLLDGANQILEHYRANQETIVDNLLKFIYFTENYLNYELPVIDYSRGLRIHWDKIQSPVDLTDKRYHNLRLIDYLLTNRHQYDIQQTTELEQAQFPEPEKPSPKTVLDSSLTGSECLRQRFLEVGFGELVQIIGLDNVRIGAGSVIGEGSWLNVCRRDGMVRLTIGQTVLVGRRNMINAEAPVEIGDFCLFGPNVYVGNVDHVTTDITKPIIDQGNNCRGTLTVEENCWLGQNVVVSGSLRIGRGSTVAANSVVIEDVPPFCIVAGNPARVIKMYNPATGSWERVQSEEDIRRIERDRTRTGIPSRGELIEILRKNAVVRRIDPIVGGGRHL